MFGVGEAGGSRRPSWGAWDLLMMGEGNWLECYSNKSEWYGHRIERSRDDRFSFSAISVEINASLLP